MNTTVLKAEGLGKTFPGRSGLASAGRSKGVRAVDDVSLSMNAGETLAVVGESGCGKSTLGRLLLRLIEPTEGEVSIDGTDVSSLSGGEMRQFRRHAQMVFQDPFGSLSPRRTIARIISEPMESFGTEATARARRERVAELLTQVGLPTAVMDRKPRHFSGGQRQRICIARAISVSPRVIIADEPVSALDVSVQAQIINLLQDLQEDSGFAMLFIAHDLAVVRHIADRVAVMYLGRIVEIGSKDQIYTAPQHPYTQALLSAVPEASPTRRRKRIVLGGDVPSPVKVPSGCSFHPRCPIAQDICRTTRPALAHKNGGSEVACHFAAPNPLG
ncbi:UNVERIFIED_ORG: peptide/nickel transport system ATP-binding protein/oligopeptide transport system ATP-binding protein [Martelella mediterranea]